MIDEIKEILGDTKISTLKTMLAGMEGNMEFTVGSGEVGWIDIEDTKIQTKKLQDVLDTIDKEIKGGE